jgi:hypothetical protein
MDRPGQIKGPKCSRLKDLAIDSQKIGELGSLRNAVHSDRVPAKHPGPNLWFAKIAIGIQIKELADPPDFVCAGMILSSCFAC